MSEKKILLVDYDRKNLDALTELFSSHKFEIIIAMDGQIAYEKFKTEKPNLVILEAMLPKLHGFDLTQKISGESKGSVPVIIITGLYRGSQYRNEALRSFGASDYFEKPYDKEKLLDSAVSLLQEDMDIETGLPDPDSVIRLLAKEVNKGISETGE
jgi:DNA-binding response OmpR family regulator